VKSPFQLPERSVPAAVVRVGPALVAQEGMDQRQLSSPSREVPAMYIDDWRRAMALISNPASQTRVHECHGAVDHLRARRSRQRAAGGSHRRRCCAMTALSRIRRLGAAASCSSLSPR